MRPGRMFSALRELFGRADPGSEAGRARARHRAIALTAVTSGAARAINILTVLVSVPLTLNYLGHERYGMWMTLSSLGLLLSFVDLGIGNSMLNALARRDGAGQHDALRVVVTSGYAAMTGIALVLAIVAAIAAGQIDWAGLFGVRSPLAAAEAAPAASAFLAIFVLTTPLTLVYRIQLGLQQGFQASLWQAAGSLLALGALALAIAAKASLPVLVLALAGTPLLVAAVASFDFLLRARPDLRPRLSAFDGAEIRRVAGHGSLFFVLQVCGALIFQTNALIIARTLGPEAVTNFAVPERLFSIVTTILMLVFVPLWPAYGEALARGDRGWARDALRRSLVMSIGAAAVMALGLAVLSPTILSWWVGNSVVVPAGLIAGFAVWKVIEASGNALAMFLNGAGQLALQAGAAVGTVAISLVLRAWWTPRFGIAGAQWGMVVAYCLCTLPVVAFAVRRTLQRMGPATPASGGSPR